MTRLEVRPEAAPKAADLAALAAAASSSSGVVVVAASNPTKSPTHKPRTDCCQNHCKTAICVPPFVAVCLQCSSPSEVLAGETLLTGAQESAALSAASEDVDAVPYKK